MKFESGNKHPDWKGGRGMHSLGYIRVHTGANKRELEHRLIIEKTLGKKMPKGSVSHHVDEIKTENGNLNLVLCENRAYHNLLHRRTRAYNECGHAGWLKCGYCGEYDDPENMYVQVKRGNRTDGRHVECHKKYMGKYHDRIKNLSKRYS